MCGQHSSEPRPELKTEPNHFDTLGGEPILRPLISQFVDRMFDDTMIGFLFRRASRERVKAMEYEHAAEHLGSGQSYTGGSLLDVHRRHQIAGGQFERRYTLLKELLSECDVPSPVQRAWLQEVVRLRPQITQDANGECSVGVVSGSLSTEAVPGTSSRAATTSGVSLTIRSSKAPKQ